MRNNRRRAILRTVIVLPMFALLSYVTACAQANETSDLPSFPRKGSIELGGSVSYQRTTLLASDQTDQTYTLFSFLPFLGYFPLDDSWEIGLNPPGIQVYTDSEQKITTVLMLADVSYNVHLAGIWTPFAEIQLGYSSETLGGAVADLNPGYTKRDGFSWGVRAGAKIEVAGHCLLNAGIQYQQITLVPKGDASRNRSDVLLLSLGLSFWL